MTKLDNHVHVFLLMIKVGGILRGVIKGSVVREVFLERVLVVCYKNNFVFSRWVKQALQTDWQ